MSNDYRAYVECDYNSIYHHGITGMKWGVRRYQNDDGSLTPEGQRRYGKLLDQRRKAHEASVAADKATKKARALEKSGVYDKAAWKDAFDKQDVHLNEWAKYEAMRKKTIKHPNGTVFNPNRKQDISDWNDFIDLENAFDKKIGRRSNRHKYSKI